MTIKTTITESREVEKEIHFPYYYRLGSKLVKAISINHTIEVLGTGHFTQLSTNHFNVEKEIVRGVQITAQEFNTALRQAQERLSKELYPHDYKNLAEPEIRKFGQPLPTKVMDLLIELSEYFDGRGDADFEGDPGHYVPNQEMQLFGEIEKILEAAGYKAEVTT